MSTPAQAWSAAWGGRSRASWAAASAARFRPTQPSTPATAAGRCWTRPAASSASTQVAPPICDVSQRSPTWHARAASRVHAGRLAGSNLLPMRSVAPHDIPVWDVWWDVAAIYTASGTSAGVGFAIGIDTVQKVVPQLLQYGKVSRPALNIQARPCGQHAGSFPTCPTWPGMLSCERLAHPSYRACLWGCLHMRSCQP